MCSFESYGIIFKIEHILYKILNSQTIKKDCSSQKVAENPQNPWSVKT